MYCYAAMCIGIASLAYTCDGLDVINVALDRPAYQTDTKVHSGAHGAAVASRAVDGNLNQAYSGRSCTTTISTTGASWEVDLGKRYHIDHVVIYNRVDCCGKRLQEVEIYVGEDRHSYLLKAYQPGKAGTISTIQIGPGVYGQWVKVTRAVANGELTLCEVQVMASPPGTTFDIYRGREGTGAALSSAAARSPLDCARHCDLVPDCSLAQYHQTSNQCTLFATQNHTDTLDTNTMVLLVND